MEGNVLILYILITGNSLLAVTLVIYNVVFFYNKVMTKIARIMGVKLAPKIQNSAYFPAG